MPVHFLNTLRHRASQMTYNSALYNWSLNAPAPDRMIVRPVDPWPGNPEAGLALCEGVMPGSYTIGSLHGFGWLRDLRAYAHQKGAQSHIARTQARGMIRQWIHENARWNAQSWEPGLLGQRIALWISTYDFFADCPQETQQENNAFQDLFFDSLCKQACHLSRALTPATDNKLYGLSALRAAKGLLYAGLAFEGRESWIEQALTRLYNEIDAQIAGDGSHKSRSPANLLKALQLLIDIRMALSAGGYPTPEKLQHAIDRTGHALQFFRYHDKKLAVFNGAQEGNADLIESILTQAGIRGKGLMRLPSTGFEKISMGRTTIVMDCGKAPLRPYDIQAHAAPLAFEMCYGRERLFVNCGTHPSDPEWQSALRATAAHNTLSLDHRNAFEIREDGHFSRKSEKTSALREETKNAILLEASHDGYEPINGMTHRRRLYLAENGDDLRGEDTLTSVIDPARPIDITLRFHLHPRVMVSLIRDGQEALLRLPGGTGWRFQLSAGLLSLENSIYLGNGTEARKTKQLVIRGQTQSKKSKILWALQKEG